VRSRKVLTVVLGTVALAVLLPATAVGAGPVNPGFEQGLTGWVPTVVPLDAGGYSGYGEAGPPVPVGCQVPNGICAVGVDTFTAEDQLPPGPASTRTYRVAPVGGTRMARLGGPFTSPLQLQPLEHYRLEQTFTVDAANPILAIAYNVFAYDYTGFDDLRVQVRVTDADGQLISDQAQPAEGSGVLLRTTGWRQAQVDLTGWAGRTVHLRFEAGGSSDTSYPFWAYVDVGKAPGGAAGKPVATSAVALDTQNDANTGERWFRADASSVSGCMPVTIAVPFTGAVSAVVLRLRPLAGAPLDLPMTRDPTTGQWRATVPCLQTARLAIAYDVTDAAGVEHRNQNLGGLVVANAMGTVYDKATFDKLRAKGLTVAAAIAKAALGGADVQLLRRFSGTFLPVLSGDPGTVPHVNPQSTANTGRFGWILQPGTYAVRVTKKGYATVTTSPATVLPQITDLNVALVASKTAALTLTKRLCGSGKQAARSRCRTDRRLVWRLARCQQKRRASARRACTRRVRRR
jgi:hypothetical protein